MSGSGHFQSILFRTELPDVADAVEPEFFRDLNLDQVVAAVVAGRDEYDLAEFFHLPLATVSDVSYRHDVFRDLADEDARAAIADFGASMRRVRNFLDLSRKQRHRYERERWLLDAASAYCAAVGELPARLAAVRTRSEGMAAFAEYLTSYATTPAFASLRADVESTLQGLDSVEYALRINGGRVTVSEYGGESDYSEEIGELFARFRQAAAGGKLLDVSDSGSMDHVEARISELVARLRPSEFDRLDRFCADHGDFLDATIARFDREVQFYLAYIAHMERIARDDARFCLPQLSHEWTGEHVAGGFDLALAAKLREERKPLVTNDFDLERAERILVVTGPNQGGKTTFARMVGQLHHLATLGVPVPATEARLVLTDRVFTHFEREEVVGNLRGKLEEELIRVRDILEEATSSSLVVMNEMFSSATAADARDLAADVLGRLVERRCVGVCVTFIDELSRLGPATVSMVAEVSPVDPAERTFLVTRRPADGRAYAIAIARKHGLSHDQLRERLAR